MVTEVHLKSHNHGYTLPWCQEEDQHENGNDRDEHHDCEHDRPDESVHVDWFRLVLFFFVAVTAEVMIALGGSNGEKSEETDAVFRPAKKRHSDVSTKKMNDFSNYSIRKRS